MYARITIQSGIAAGTSHLIESRVARVGSDPQSDVCLPTADVPEHALTLEFQNENCRVYNRSRDSIYVGAQIVKPNDVVEWPETDILQIGSNTELLLDFDAEADASYLELDDEQVDAEFEVAGSIDNTTKTTDDKSRNAKTLGFGKTSVQLTVTVGCIIGCIALLVRDQNRKAAPSPGPNFSDIVTRSMESDEVSPALIQRIQFAEAQRIRGRKQIAQQEYQSIRDDLIASQTEGNSLEMGSHSEILHFIKSRIK